MTFPAYINNSNDYVTLDTPITTVNGETYKIRVFVTNSIYMVNGTTLQSEDLSCQIGYNNTQLVFKVGGSAITYDLPIQLLSNIPFIFECEFERTTNTTSDSILFKIYDVDLAVIAEWTTSHNDIVWSDFTQLFRMSTDNTVIETPDMRFYIGGVLAYWWTYTGGEIGLIQERLNGNHLLISYDNLSLCQGDQSYFNPYIDGLSEDVFTDNIRNSGSLYWTAISGSGVVVNFGIDEVEIRGNNTVTQSQFRNTSNNTIKFENVFAKAGEDYLYKVVINVEKIGSDDSFMAVDIGDSFMICTNTDVIFSPIASNERVLINDDFNTPKELTWVTDLGDLGITNNWIDFGIFDGDNEEVDNTDANNRIHITDIKIYVKIGNYYLELLQGLPQEPFNGEDVYGNTLTFIDKNVKKAKRFTT